jgi:hypothetical protein
MVSIDVAAETISTVRPPAAIRPANLHTTYSGPLKSFANDGTTNVLVRLPQEWRLEEWTYEGRTYLVDRDSNKARLTPSHSLDAY